MNIIRASRPRKMPVFLGCEGASEVAYGQFLARLLAAANLAVHLEVVALNPGAGDPLSLIKRIIKELPRREARRTPFKLKIVLMDADRLQNDRVRKSATETLAQDHGIGILWQRPCHEALLLRHFEGHQNQQPADCRSATALLQKLWPDYEKPMSTTDLARRIDQAGLFRAASVEPAVQHFLAQIGLLPAWSHPFTS